MRLELSMHLPTFSAGDPDGWGHLRSQAVAAERVGIDRLVCSDHVVFGEDLDAYADPKRGGRVGGRLPTGADGHWLDPFTVLTWLAGQTSQVRLGTNILIAALRRPVVLAKQLATLDVLSGGRIDLGVGVGWQKEEYDAAGLDYSRRGELLDHSLAVCQTLWREERASYGDDFLAFAGIHQMPKPQQRGGVPIWVSGTVNARVVRRLSRFGLGWIPWGEAAADLPSSIAAIKGRLREAGRDDVDALQVVGSLPMKNEALDVDGTAELIAAGVTDLRIPFRSLDDADVFGATSELLAAFHRRFGS